MPKRNDINKILIIGSGPIIIGQACEFDYSGTQACKALKKLGYEIVLVNSNPATIMTDPATADATYIEPLNVDRLTQIIAKERPDALLPNLGGQSGLNLCEELYAAGVPFNSCEFQSKGDAITDLHENLSAEQKARSTYDNLIRIIDDPDVREPLKFLRAREIVHFQRFGEALEKIKGTLDSRNFYYFNPEFDKQMAAKVK